MNNYLTIIKKYLEGEISLLEKEKLKQWLEDDAANETIFKEEIKNWCATQKGMQVKPDKAYERFVGVIAQKETKVISFKPWIKMITYAAVVTGVLFGVYYYTVTNESLFKSSPNVVEVDYESLDKIKIVQADGTITYMDFEDTGNVVDPKGNLVVKKEQDQLIVQSSTASSKTEYLEISIPKGKLFQLSLSDGTKVWLNAASTLRFPQHFDATDKNRLVHLEGEAFFDVTTNKEQPFIVKTGVVDVEVLGTQFNISSYSEDSTVKTTLVEGAVAVNDPSNVAKNLRLTPNHQAIYSKENKVLQQKKVNTALFTSWMYRKIILQNESFTEVCKRIERTYDVEITSTNEKLNNTRFTGEFDIENVRQILNVFSETIAFTYTIKDKKITINP
ncbi:FecR family protein [Aquimarina sp. AU474]|uniref:FecR family protein n=1 Tax=Aquimarina sp. AU474 TaxID=2108529 RepID=UPI000D685BB5|nr:FecR domain-containing protein [Aquimarina sp. AU474]